MIGHDKIISLRLRGYTPQQVFVTVWNSELEYFPGTHPSQNFQNGFRAAIDVTPRDTGALDFRCLTGLVVHLHGSVEHRVMAIRRQIVRVTPAMVITYLPDRLQIDSFVEQPEFEAS